MTGALITLAVIGGYVWMVGRTAKRYAVEETEKTIAEYPDLALKPGKVAEWRKENLGFGIPVGLVWPIYYAWRAWSRHTLGSLPPTSVELRLREKHIEELEKQLLDKPYDPKRKYYG